MALHRRQRGGEHHLWERLPERGPLELSIVEGLILFGGLPVQHRLVETSSHQVNADSSDFVDAEAKTSSSGAPQSKPPPADDVAVK